MTRYSELYRAEQAEKQRLQLELEIQIKRRMQDLEFLREFIRENGLETKLAEWSVRRGSPQQ